jgi:hypothetical protein
LRPGPFAAALALVLISGCAQVRHEGSLVLEFTLHQLGGEDGSIGEWPHCSTAHEADDEVVVEATLDPRAKGHPVLLVVPRLGPGTTWGVTGDASFALGLHREALVPDGLDDTTTPLVRITWDGDGPAVVDGVQRPLPAEWTKADPAGRWSADLSLREGPERVRWTSSSGSCA